MGKHKRKPHYLVVRYPDGSQTHDRIDAVTEDGITVDDEGTPLTLSPNWLDEHRCWIDDYRHRLPRPYSKHHKSLVSWIVPKEKACENCSSRQATA